MSTSTMTMGEGNSSPSSTPRRRSTVLQCSTCPCPRGGSTSRRPGCGSRVAQPDWVILRSTGFMTPAALKAAAQVGIPRDKIVGIPRPARAGHGASRGGGQWLHLRHLSWYGDRFAHPGYAHVRLCLRARGQVRRGRSARCLGSGHAGRRAHYGSHPHSHARIRQSAPDGGQVVGGSNTSMSPQRLLRSWGRRGCSPRSSSRAAIMRGGGVKFQQWDGQQWTVLTDWIAPDQALVRPWWRRRRPSMRRTRGSRRGPAREAQDALAVTVLCILTSTW